MMLTTEVLVAGFGLAMAWYGAELARTTWAAATPMIGISQGWDFVPMSAAGVLVTLFAIEKLARLFLAGPDALPVGVNTGHTDAAGGA